MKKKEKFLHQYMNSYTPVGEEHEGQKIWMDYIKPYVETINVDPYGTAFCLIPGSDLSDNRLKVVIEAHVDSIAWQVSKIGSDNMLRIKRAGGSDNMIARSKIVVVRTHDGVYHRGVIGSPAIHTRSKQTDMGPEQHELWVDMGLPREDIIALGIEVGNLVMFEDKFSKIGNYWTGISLDNKIGGYIISQVAKRISKEDKLPYDLYIVNATQEEVGLHGAKQIADRLKPSLAIVHDVCHNCNVPMLNQDKEGDTKGGDGPSIQYTAQNHRKVLTRIKSVAKEKKIPLQLEIGSYGNDTMGFFLSNGGTPTAIISTPLSYMHTTVEMAHVNDVENAINLFVETLKSIDVDFINDLHNR